MFEERFALGSLRKYHLLRFRFEAELQSIKASNLKP